MCSKPTERFKEQEGGWKLGLSQEEKTVALEGVTQIRNDIHWVLPCAYWAKSIPCSLSFNGPWLIGSCWWLWLRMALLKGKQGQEAVSRAFLYKGVCLPFITLFLKKKKLFLKVLHVPPPQHPIDLFYLPLPPVPALHPRPLHHHHAFLDSLHSNVEFVFWMSFCLSYSRVPRASKSFSQCLP